MTTIKAIETQYKGYRFRSRLEARWAVFFDALGVKWEYEPEGYDLGDLGYYLPDFLVTLSNRQYKIEIKPVYPSRLEIEKARQIHTYIIAGTPGVDNDVFSYVIVEPTTGAIDETCTAYLTNHYVFCACRYCGKSIGIELSHALVFERDLMNGIIANDEQCYASCFTCCRPEKDWESDLSNKRILAAYIAARSARFEHGEKPNL